MRLVCFFFFQQKTAYELRISVWSSDVCSSDLPVIGIGLALVDFLDRQFVRADGIAPRQLGRGGIVGDRLDLEDVEAAKIGDLLKAERGAIDQPRSGRVRQERLGRRKKVGSGTRGVVHGDLGGSRISTKNTN